MDMKHRKAGIPIILRKKCPKSKNNLKENIYIKIFSTSFVSKYLVKYIFWRL